MCVCLCVCVCVCLQHPVLQPQRWLPLEGCVRSLCWHHQNTGMLLCPTTLSLSRAGNSAQAPPNGPQPLHTSGGEQTLRGKASSCTPTSSGLTHHTSPTCSGSQGSSVGGEGQSNAALFQNLADLQGQRQQLKQQVGRGNVSLLGPPAHDQSNRIEPRF